ncbi:Sec-independent protein translocase protein TatB [Stappia stellulata]|uniref:Sec-independent protein translocase protein TatB n=1 Tax=Stappia stellulata TaxID=71235 RepID=UPI0004246650|nr:Sec-independent protein translocase protein TatB [Stappia stellulata]
MFDIGWTELLVVAVVMILVVGPKDLPRMLRTFGQTMGKVKRMANEFQSTFNDALREAEQQADIADMKKQVEKAGNFDPLGDIKKSVNMDKPAGKAKSATPEPLETEPAIDFSSHESSEETGEPGAKADAGEPQAPPADSKTRPTGDDGKA